MSADLLTILSFIYMCVYVCIYLYLYLYFYLYLHTYTLPTSLGLQKVNSYKQKNCQGQESIGPD